MSLHADPIAPPTTTPAEIDPMLEAIAQAIMDSADLPEFSASPRPNVVPCAPEDSAEEINNRIAVAMGKSRGLCLLVVAGGGKNEDESAPGPRCKVQFELQLYAAPIGTRRPKNSRKVLALVVAIMRLLHNQQLQVVGCPWFELITCDSFDPVPDPDFTAYTITFNRDMQF